MRHTSQASSTYFCYISAQLACQASEGVVEASCRQQPTQREDMLIIIIIIIIILTQISSRRQCWTKVQGRCVSRITLMSKLLCSIACVAVWSVEQFCLQCMLECLQSWQWRDHRWQHIRNFCSSNEEGTIANGIVQDRGTCSEGDDADRRRVQIQKPKANMKPNPTLWPTLWQLPKCCGNWEWDTPGSKRRKQGNKHTVDRHVFWHLAKKPSCKYVTQQRQWESPLQWVILCNVHLC